MVKKPSAPAWLIAEAIDFLKKQHPSVLQAVANMFLKSKHETIEGWLAAEAPVWGTRIMTLITHMRHRWEYDLLSECWCGIVTRAMKDQGLIEEDGRRVAVMPPSTLRQFPPRRRA